MKVKLFFALCVYCIPFFALSQDLNVISADSLNNYKYEYIPADDNYDFIQDRLSCLEGTIPLNYNNKVHAFVNHFVTRDRSFAKKIIRRKEFFFPVFEKYLKKHGLPDELKYLSVIESGLNPRAVSSARAVGLWQFMSYTGRSFGLHQDNYIDERMDYERATDAACRFLKQLYGMFGDWELAIAAYNTGPGNVRKAMRRSGKKKFWDIYPYLHRETRAYLPQFVAIIYTLNYLEEYSFDETPRDFHVEYDTIMISKYTHIPTLAGLMNLCSDEIQDINPGLKFNAFPDLQKAYPLRLPSYAMAEFEERREFLLDSASKVDKAKVKLLAGNARGSTYGKDKIVYRVRSGDVLGKIALRYKVRVSDLREWNSLRGDMIRVGQRLNIWLKPGAYKASTNKQVAKVSKPVPPPLESKTGETYTVQPGDTLWDISKMFKNLSIEKIKRLNGLTSDSIKPGQKLKVG